MNKIAATLRQTTPTRQSFIAIATLEMIPTVVGE